MEIEKCIPLPEGRNGPRTEASKTAYRMVKGDSVLCNTHSEVETVVATIRVLGGRACRRKTDGGWRVWRVE